MSTAYCLQIEIREMVSFEHGKEIEKDFVFVLSRAWDKEKILISQEESNIKIFCMFSFPNGLYFTLSYNIPLPIAQ